MPHITVNGINYHYRDQGQGSPLVLLHGFTGSSESWEELSDMAARHCRMIAIDLPGHGLFASPSQPQPLSMPAVANDITTVLNTLEIRKPDLLGYSMGGRLALYLAIQKPSLFTSLILESASPGLKSAKLRQERIQKDDLLAKKIESEGVPVFVECWEKLPLFESQNKISKERQEVQHRRRLNNSAVGLSNSLRGMGTGRQPSLWPELINLAIPTLLLVGALDHKYVEINRKMAQKIPESKLKIISSSGHNVHLEELEQFVRTVLSFLKSPKKLSYAEEKHK